MVAGNRTSNHQWLILQFALLLLLCISKSNAQSPVQSPALEPEPDLPLLAPSPLMPFTNISTPNLSGKCPLNFSNAKTVLTTTAIDCWSSLAPYLANVVCCPQLDATIKILIGQSSFSSGTLSISETHAKDCLSDISQVLEAQGSSNNLLEICLIHPSNLTQASCPMVDLIDIEKTINIPTIIESCEKIDPVKECRHKVCERVITDAAVKIASTSYSIPDMAVVDDCKKIVLRWLASKFDSAYANKVLRGISSCKIDKVCPLVFPDMKSVSKECGNTIRNQTSCCDAMENYITQLQDQSFITNLQALNCASSLASNLQKANVSSNIYNNCHVKLKDFSLQGHGTPSCYTKVGSQGSGCLFPSLPFDVTYDQSSGIGFKCDLNDNIEAPWPSFYASSPSPSSSINLPALPKAASGQSGLRSSLFVSILLVLNLFISR